MDKQYYIDNHIGIFKNFMPNEMIDDYINYFNKCEQQGAVYPRREDEMLVSDNAIDTIRDTNVAMTYNNKPFIDMFFKVGEGYHFWHCENAAMKARNRILAFMVYLNDVAEGGETEFLYQKCRFKPEKNTLLVWPSQFTHVHRGNPPLSNDKYVITGWVEYGY
jgi:hypothetical protein